MEIVRVSGGEVVWVWIFGDGFQLLKKLQILLLPHLGYSGRLWFENRHSNIYLLQ